MGVTNGVLNIFCAAAVAVLLAAVCTGGRKHVPTATRIFRFVLGAAVGMLLTDGFALAFLNPDGWAFHTMEGVSFGLFYVMLALYAQFIATVAGVRSKAADAAKLVCWVLCGINGVLWVTNCFTPLFYDVEGQTFISSALYYAVSSLGLLVLASQGVLLFFCRKKLNRWDIVVLASMTLLPLLSDAIRLLQPELSLRYAMVTLVLFINYTRIMLNAERRLRAQELEAEKNRTQLLRERMKPHYIYNVLSSIYYLCETDPKTAQQAVSIFSDYLRGVLEMMDHGSLVPFSQELKTVYNYVDLEKMRFGDRFEIRYNIETTSFMIPPFTVQPLVENAVKHGVEKQGGAGEVLLECYEDPHGYYVSVYDNCGGFDPAAEEKPGGFGTKYIRDMLSITGAGKLMIESAPDGWTVATVFIHK